MRLRGDTRDRARLCMFNRPQARFPEIHSGALDYVWPYASELGQRRNRRCVDRVDGDNTYHVLS